MLLGWIARRCCFHSRAADAQNWPSLCSAASEHKNTNDTPAPARQPQQRTLVPKLGDELHQAPLHGSRKHSNSMGACCSLHRDMPGPNVCGANLMMEGFRGPIYCHKGNRGLLHSIVCSLQMSSATLVKAKLQNNNPFQLPTCPLQADAGHDCALKGKSVTQRRRRDQSSIMTWQQSPHRNVFFSGTGKKKQTKKKTQLCVTDHATPQSPVEHRPHYNDHLWWMCIARKTNVFSINKTFLMEFSEETPPGTIPQATAILDLGKYHFCKSCQLATAC